MIQRTLIDDDGNQTLLRLWDETATTATRRHSWETWSAPVVYTLLPEEES